MNETNKEREWYSQQFSDFEKSLNGQSEQPLHQIRKKAITWFEENGFPSIKEEEWRFTNVTPISRSQFSTQTPNADAVSLEALHPLLIDENFYRLVFINGVFNAELSSNDETPEGVTIASLKTAMKNEQESISANLAKHAAYQENGFVALNTAFLNDGAFVHVRKNIILERPILFLYVATDNATERIIQPRNLIVADENAQVQVIESYSALTNSAYFTNPVTEIVAAHNAVVDHYKIQNESISSFHTSLMQIHQKRSSVFRSHNYALGGAIARNDLNAMLDGEGIECTLNGLYLASGKQLIDNHSVIDHAKPHCNSHELYKGILDENARAVFSGKIHVHPDAQKTDAIQSNQNLVLSDNATVDTKPQLEIYADDVRCTHGGTIGQMDEDGIFYLRARGIGEQTARHLMIQAFAGEVAESMTNEVVREHIENLVLNRLKGGRLAVE